MRVVNVAVTQGSRVERRHDRFEELTGACRYLGFGLIQTREGGLEKITAAAREQEPRHWERAVERIRAIIAETRPRAVFFPHDDDGNSTHVGTHFLVADALARAATAGPLHVFETEFWRPMADPNLMVESGEHDVADLVAALSFHVGEVERNPYHLRLPAWMIDNVRRGGELVGRQGGAPPDFTFATIYRHSRWENGKAVRSSSASVSATDDLNKLLTA
jgi:LmbE family N-acetylglucosaminyl deacetylase